MRQDSMKIRHCTELFTRTSQRVAGVKEAMTFMQESLVLLQQAVKDVVSYGVEVKRAGVSESVAPIHLTNTDAMTPAASSDDA